MKILYLDCGMGAAGDMLTAALLELHPDRRSFLNKINSALGGKANVISGKDEKCGIAGTHVSVEINGDVEGKKEEHHHSHTSVKEIMEFIGGIDLPEKVREDAVAVFSLIADAESKVHGRPVENIHFHEVGSIDVLADVLCVCGLIYELSPDKIIASSVNVGSGFVKCAHGILPVPAPATEYILKGVPIYSGDIKSELCTPTGAALLKYFVSEFISMPEMKIEKTGYGTGTKDFEQANILRAMLGETDGGRENVIELACNIDDMTAEDLGYAMERLFEKGALDVYFTNIGMKKCRPGTMMTCMCREQQREEMLECMFRNTTTLGIREYSCSRYYLTRSFHTVDTGYGQVRIKRSEGYGVYKEKAEFEDIAAIAKKTDIPITELRKKITDEKR